MIGDNVIYKISCHNEWCSGPEGLGYKTDRPPEPQHCPTCGWPAMYGSGIRRVDMRETGKEEKP